MAKLTLPDALAALTGHSQPFIKLFNHGSLEVEIYRPIGVDLQQPHSRDELYVIAAGSATFTEGSSKYPVVTGDVIFVSAGVDHRFSLLSDDFSTWVFFYGPEGGEAG